MEGTKFVIRDLRSSGFVVNSANKFSFYGLLEEKQENVLNERLIEDFLNILTQSQAFHDGYVCPALKQAYNESELQASNLFCLREELSYGSRWYFSRIGSCHAIVTKDGRVVNVIPEIESKCPVNETRDPQVSEVTLDGTEDCILLASSAFWKQVTHDEAAELMNQRVLESEVDDSEEVERKLSEELLRDIKKTSDGRHGTAVVVLLRPIEEILRRPRIVCSSPYNGNSTIKNTEISLSEFSIIDQSTPKVSGSSLNFSDDGSMYQTAYDATQYTMANDILSPEQQGNNFQPRNVIAAVAEIHAISSPSPNSEAGDSTMMENSGTLDAKSNDGFSPSPILSPSPDLDLMASQNDEVKAGPNTASQQAEFPVLSSPSPALAIQSESCEASPSSVSATESFDFKTCSAFSQQDHQEQEKQQQQNNEKSEVEPEIVVTSDQAEEGVEPEGCSQREVSENLVQVIASQREQSHSPPLESQEQQEEVGKMFPPLESATSCKEELKIEEEIEEQKIEESQLIQGTKNDTSDLFLASESPNLPLEPSNPFADLEGEVQVMSPSPDILISDKNDKVNKANGLNHENGNSSPSDLTTTMNFNQVILEATSISPTSQERSDSFEHLDSNGHNGYNSSFAEATVIENTGASLEDDDESENKLQLPCPPAPKFQDESEDSDDSQDSVKENVLSPPPILSDGNHEEATVDVCEVSCTRVIEDQQLLTASPDSMSNDFGPGVNHSPQQREAGGFVPSSDTIDQLRSTSDPIEDVTSPSTDYDDQVKSDCKQRSEELNVDDEAFNSNDLRRSESEIEVTNENKVNGSPPTPNLLQDGSFATTKDGETICGLEPTSSPVPVDEPQGLITKEQIAAEPALTNSDVFDLLNNGTEDLQADSTELLSKNNISKVEMPTPMRNYDIDINNLTSDDGQWGAPSLLMGHQLEMMNGSAKNVDLETTLSAAQGELREAERERENVEGVIAKSEKAPTTEVMPRAKLCEDLKPEVMSEIMRQDQFSPRISTPVERVPLSPPPSSQLTDSVPDLIAQSQTLDLIKTAASKAKLSTGAGKPSSTTLKTNGVTKEKPISKVNGRLSGSAATKPSSAASKPISAKPLAPKAAAPSSRQPIKTTRPTVSSAPKPTTSTSRITTKPAVVNSTSRSSTAAAAARKPATAPPKTLAPRVTSTITRPANRTAVGAAKPLPDAGKVKLLTVTSRVNNTRPLTTTASTANRNPTTRPTLASKTSTTASNGLVSKPSTTLRVAPKSSVTSAMASRNLVKNGAPLVPKAGSSRLTTAAKKLEVSKPPSGTIASRAVKKPIKTPAVNSEPVKSVGSEPNNGFL